MYEAFLVLQGIRKILRIAKDHGRENTNSNKSSTTVKPVLVGHLWEEKGWPYKTGDLLKEVQLI